MADTMRDLAADCQATAIDRLNGDRSTTVDQPSELDLLRQVVAEKGETLDSLSAHMRERGHERDRSYIHKVLNGDKPMPEGFTDDLPDEVQAEWHARCAKRLKRHHVVPVLTREEALDQYLAGVVNLNAPCELPAKAGPALKVNLDKRKAAAR